MTDLSNSFEKERVVRRVVIVDRGPGLRERLAPLGVTVVLPPGSSERTIGER
jgi:hypothetical protein